MDRITLRGIRAYGKHGVFAHERARDAPFDIDVSIEADLQIAARSDDLTDTIDYAAIHATLVRIVASTSFALLERLAAEIVGAIATDTRAVAVTVTVAKPGLLDGATPAVTLDWKRT